MSLDINSIPGFDAQIAHVGWGAALALGFGLFAPAVPSVLLAVGISFAKEAAEATGIAPWEPKQTWSSSLVDFGFFAVGIGLAALLFFIKSV